MKLRTLKIAFLDSDVDLLIPGEYPLTPGAIAGRHLGRDSARGQTRDIDFTTREGTFMSVDLSRTAAGSSLICWPMCTSYLSRGVRLSP